MEGENRLKQGRLKRRLERGQQFCLERLDSEMSRGEEMDNMERKW